MVVRNMTEGQYKYLYEKCYIKCERCNGTGRVKIPGLMKMDRYAHHDSSPDYLGDNEYKCGACGGKGEIFDPVETWGLDTPKKK